VNLAIAESVKAEQKTSDSIPSHRELPLTGLHIYTDRLSYSAGETVSICSSASIAHELQVVCLGGSDVERPTNDEILHSWRVDRPFMQPITPGSYLHIVKGLGSNHVTGLTIECWVRLWRLHEPQAIITQSTMEEGFALIVFPSGKIGFFTGECANAFETEQVSSLALTLPDTARSDAYIVPPATWHHIVALSEANRRELWIDGRHVGEWQNSQPLRPANTPLRIGAIEIAGYASNFLDADIAMPVIYNAALTPDAIRTRCAQRGLIVPEIDDSILGCWPLVEEKGDLVEDVSPHRRHAKLINHATWMIGGPSFIPAVARYKPVYEPKLDKTRGHGIRLASDDLYDCRWQVTHAFKLPDDCDPGLYSIRGVYDQAEEELVKHSVFVVRRSKRVKKSPITFLFSTNTYKAYSGAPFCDGWKGKTPVGNKGYRSRPDDDRAAYCFYRFHRAGQPTYQLGWNLPWPAASPCAGTGDPELGYAHLSQADLWSFRWLRVNGYQPDALSDTDLQFDDHALDDTRVLFIVGHSEYWSSEAMARVRRFIDQGGKVICLSGNTMFWRVSFSTSGDVLECRKSDGWGAQLATYMRGECWHEHDQIRGGVLRDVGDPAWKTLGIEFAGAISMKATVRGAFHVVASTHTFLTSPIPTDLEKDQTFGFDPQYPAIQPLGHETDVRLSSLMKVTQRGPLPSGFPTNLTEPLGITLIAEGRWNSDGKVGSYRDYSQRLVPSKQRDSSDSLCDMIHWKCSGGGEVFAAPSIAAGWTLDRCPKWSNILKNVLHHFLKAQDS